MSEDKTKGLTVGITVDITHTSRMSQGHLGGYSIKRETFPADKGMVEVVFSSRTLAEHPVLKLIGDPRELAGVFRRIAEGIEEMG